MDLFKLASKAEKLAIDNSPLILTVVGATGSIAASYLTAKATFQAAKKIKDAEFVIHTTDSKNAELTKPQKVKLVWHLYILPTSVLGVSVGAIVMSHKISMSRMAALAAGYTLLSERTEELRGKVVEKLGGPKADAAKTELAQERVNNNPPPAMIITAGKQLFRDETSGRYFESTMEDVKRAMNDVNYQIMNREYAVLTDLYERLGLAATSISEEFGWDLGDQVDIAFNAVITPDGKPCITMDYNVKPIRNGAPNAFVSKIRAVRGD